MAEPVQPNKIETLKELKTIMFTYYMNILKEKKEGKKLTFINALGPLEILLSFDSLTPAYPENHAAAIQARHMAVETAEAAEGFGYTPDICSYARCDIGSFITGASPIGGMPQPDLLVFSSNQCWTIAKWWESMSRKWNIPYYLIDVPSQGRGMSVPMDANSVGYVEEQLWGLVEFLEKHTGEKFDEDKYRHILKISKRSCELWRKIIESGKNVPSPITMFDQYLAMAPIVGQRGEEGALRFYERLWAEVEDRVKNGVGSIPGEKFRLYWDGLPLWHNMKDFYNILAEKRAVLNANNYTIAWADLEVDPERPMRNMAMKYLRYYDTQIEDRARDILRYYHSYRLDGFILHSDHSCRFLSLGLMDAAKRVQEETGVPAMLLDTDHGDPRLYQSETIKTRVHAYLETLEAAPKRGSGEEIPDPREMLVQDEANLR